MGTSAVAPFHVNAGWQSPHSFVIQWWIDPIFGSGLNSLWETFSPKYVLPSLRISGGSTNVPNHQQVRILRVSWEVAIHAGSHVHKMIHTVTVCRPAVGHSRKVAHVFLLLQGQSIPSGRCIRVRSQSLPWCPRQMACRQPGPR